MSNRAQTEQIPNITTLYKTELLIARNYLQFSVHNLHSICNIYISIDNILIPLVPFQSFLKGGRKLSLAPSSYSTIFTDIPSLERTEGTYLPAKDRVEIEFLETVTLKIGGLFALSSV